MISSSSSSNSPLPIKQLDYMRAINERYLNEAQYNEEFYLNNYGVGYMQYHNYDDKRDNEYYRSSSLSQTPSRPPSSTCFTSNFDYFQRPRSYGDSFYYKKHSNVSSTHFANPYQNEKELSNSPSHFQFGSLIQLSDGSLKRIEELTTNDFIQSARMASNKVEITKGVIQSIERTPGKQTNSIWFLITKSQQKVTVEAREEHPFFVYNQGWSSVNPKKTLSRFNLSCRQLIIGDPCISLIELNSKEDIKKLNEEHLMPPPTTNLRTKLKRSYTISKHSTTSSCPKDSFVKQSTIPYTTNTSHLEYDDNYSLDKKIIRRY